MCLTVTTYGRLHPQWLYAYLLFSPIHVICLGERHVIKVGAKGVKSVRIEYVPTVDPSAQKCFYKLFPNLRNRVKLYEAWRDGTKLVFTAVMKKNDCVTLVTSRRSRNNAMQFRNNTWSNPWTRDI